MWSKTLWDASNAVWSVGVRKGQLALNRDECLLIQESKTNQWVSLSPDLSEKHWARLEFDYNRL